MHLTVISLSIIIIPNHTSHVNPQHMRGMVAEWSIYPHGCRVVGAESISALYLSMPLSPVTTLPVTTSITHVNSVSTLDHAICTTALHQSIHKTKTTPLGTEIKTHHSPLLIVCAGHQG